MSLRSLSHTYFLILTERHAHLVSREPRKFSDCAQRWHSVLTRIRVGAVYIRAQRVILGPSTLNVASAHAFIMDKHIKLPYWAGGINLKAMDIHIGKEIEEELRRQERSVSWLARKINCDRTNIYRIFRRQDIDTNLLLRISQALNRNFFELYSNSCDKSSTDV